MPRDGGGFVSRSHHRRTWRPNKPELCRLAKESPPKIFFATNVNVIETAVQVQAFGDIIGLPRKTLLDVLFQQLLTEQDSVPIATTAPQAAMLYLDSIIGQITIQNTTNTTNVFRMYECYPRADQCAADAAVGALSPSQIVSDGMIQVCGQSNPAGQIGADAFMSQSFVQKYKVVRTRDIRLAPGEEHIHSFQLNLNWAVDRTTMFGPAGASSTQNVQFFRDRTYTILGRFMGSLCADGNDNDVGISKSQHIMLTTYRAKYGYVVNDLPSLQYSWTPSEITDPERVLNPRQGTDEAYDEL